MQCSMSRLHKITVSSDKKKHLNLIRAKAHINTHLIEAAHTCKIIKNYTFISLLKNELMLIL